MFYAAVAAGDDVTKGQVIGTVGSLFGEPLEEVVSPVDGTVLFLTTSPAVKAEGLLIGIGVED
jgi:predicted deacylase